MVAMSAMTLRNLDPEVLETLRGRARTENRSLHSLICEILTEAAGEEQRRARMCAQRPEAERLPVKACARYWLPTF